MALRWLCNLQSVAFDFALLGEHGFFSRERAVPLQPRPFLLVVSTCLDAPSEKEGEEVRGMGVFRRHGEDLDSGIAFSAKGEVVAQRAAGRRCS